MIKKGIYQQEMLQALILKDLSKNRLIFNNYKINAH